MTFLSTKASQDSLRYALQGCEKKKPREPQYNLWYSSQFLNSASKSTIEPYLPIFARILGATPLEVGLLAGVFSLVNISQIFWARIAIRLDKFKLPAFCGKLVSGLLFIPMIFLSVGQIILLLFIRFFQGLFTSAATSTESSLMAEHIPQEKRTSKLPLFTRFNLIGTFVGTLLGGLGFSWLTVNLRFDTQLVFTFFFFWTGILGILGALIFFKSVPEYQTFIQSVSPEMLILEHTINAPSKLSWFSRAHAYLMRFNVFYRLCFFASLFYFAIHLAGPFFIILEIEVYHLSFFEASILTSVSISCQILVSVLERKRKLFDRLGTRYVLFPALFCLCVVSLLTTVPFYISGIPAFLWCIGVWIILGIGWGLFNTAIPVLLFNTIHPKYRPTLLAIYNTLTGFMMFLGPIIGGILIQLSQELIIVFLTRFILLIGIFFLLFFVKDPEVPASLVSPMMTIYKMYVRTTARGKEIIITHLLHRTRLKA